MIKQASQETVINALVRELRRSLASDRRNATPYIFMFGAGTSASCDIPLAPTMVDDLLERLRDEGKISRDAFPPQKLRDYQWVMSQYTPREQASIIRDYIERAKNSSGRWKTNHCYAILAHIWGIYRQCKRLLLTTNFDPLFTYALLERGIDAKLVRYFREIEHMSPFDTEDFPTVIHLHGYWQNHHLYNDLAAFGAYASNWAKTLAPPLMNFGIVVLGYSGHVSDVFMQTIMRIRNELGTQIAGELYWCRLADSQIDNPTYAALSAVPNVFEVPIASADSFMLDLGVQLGISEAQAVKAFAHVFKKEVVGRIATYANNAHAEAPVDETSSISITTHPKFERPGENCAGTVIYVAKGELDLREYRHMIVEYDATLEPGPSAGTREFEIKLASLLSGHIEYAPVGLGKTKRISLECYSNDGVDLGKVTEIVIGADCLQIGRGSTLNVFLRSVAWE